MSHDDKHARKLRSILQRLNHPGTPEEERKTCQRIADALREKYPHLRDLDPTPGEAVLLWSEPWQRELLEHIGMWLDLEVIDDRADDKRKAKAMRFRGPTWMTEVVEHVYDQQRPKLQKALDLTLFGYINGAMPMPVREPVHEPGPATPAPHGSSPASGYEFPAGHARGGTVARSGPLPTRPVPDIAEDDVFGAAVRLGRDNQADTGRKQIKGPRGRRPPRPSPFWKKP